MSNKRSFEPILNPVPQEDAQIATSYGGRQVCLFAESMTLVERDALVTAIATKLKGASLTDQQVLQVERNEAVLNNFANKQFDGIPRLLTSHLKDESGTSATHTGVYVQVLIYDSTGATPSDVLKVVAQGVQ